MKKYSFIFYLILLVQVTSPTLYAMEQHITSKDPTLKTAYKKKLQKILRDVLQNIELNKPYTPNIVLSNSNSEENRKFKKLLYKEYHQELDTIFSKLKPIHMYKLKIYNTDTSITTIRIDYYNNNLFAGLENGNIEIWDLNTKKCKTILNTKIDLPVVNIKISPKSDILNITFLNGKKKLWNINTDEFLEHHQSLPKKMNYYIYYKHTKLQRIEEYLPSQPQINLPHNDFFVIETQDDTLYLKSITTKQTIFQLKFKPNHDCIWKKPPAIIDSNNTLVVNTPKNTIEIFKIYLPEDFSFLELILLIKLQQAADQGYLQSIKLNKEWEDVLRNIRSQPLFQFQYLIPCYYLYVLLENIELD